MKKAFKWFAGGGGILLLVLLLGAISHGWYVRYSDTSYHDKLARTVTLRSKAFEEQGLIPAEFSCERESSGSPPLEWPDIPEGVRSFALIVTDPDIPSSTIQVAEFTHWVLYNIPADVRELHARITNDSLSESGVTVGDNGAGQKRFYPPCPVSGTHDYLFRLYALDVETIQPKREDKQGILAAMEEHLLGYGELVGRYRCQTFDFKAAFGWNMTQMEREH